MLIERHSGIPGIITTVRAVAHFVTERCLYSDMSRTRLQDASVAVISGCAARIAPGANCLIAPSLVTLRVCDKGSKTYPFKTSYVAEVGVVSLGTWEEELLFVLAHELRHIDQFWTTQPLSENEHDLEVDAERFAVETLHAYRQEALENCA